MLTGIGDHVPWSRPSYRELFRSPGISELATRVLGQHALVEYLSEPEIVRRLLLEVQRIVGGSFARPLSFRHDLSNRRVGILVTMDRKGLAGKELVIHDLIAVGIPGIRRQRLEKLVEGL